MAVWQHQNPDARHEEERQYTPQDLFAKTVELVPQIAIGSAIAYVSARVLGVEHQEAMFAVNSWGNMFLIMGAVVTVAAACQIAKPLAQRVISHLS